MKRQLRSANKGGAQGLARTHRAGSPSSHKTIMPFRDRTNKSSAKLAYNLYVYRLDDAQKMQRVGTKSIRLNAAHPEWKRAVKAREAVRANLGHGYVIVRGDESPDGKPIILLQPRKVT